MRRRLFTALSVLSVVIALVTFILGVWSDTLQNDRRLEWRGRVYAAGLSNGRIGFDNGPEVERFDREHGEVKNRLNTIHLGGTLKALNPRLDIPDPDPREIRELVRRLDLLDPAEAFGYFHANGVSKVVCEEKHMGSRAVVIVCRDEQAATKRFDVREGAGIIYTRTGRPFFEDTKVESELLGHLREALTRENFWDEFASDWFCLDCELMPWSVKAQELVKTQYAAVGSAGPSALAEVVSVLEQAEERYRGNSETLPMVLQSHRDRRQMLDQYVAAYRAYCWPVRSVADLRLAPFHLLASEGRVHVDKDHLWHMRTLGRLAAEQSPIMQSRFQRVDLESETSRAEGIAWWESLTAAGGEGMVVKPFDFVVRGPRGLVQPAVKCRGREYLRIIYGPEYTAPGNLERLRSRGLAAKRSPALREFALGIEALERFVRREPLRQVHECVFAVLALESEPVDPRL